MMIPYSNTASLELFKFYEKKTLAHMVIHINSLKTNSQKAS